jgi:hypothetical protein
MEIPMTTPNLTLVEASRIYADAEERLKKANGDVVEYMTRPEMLVIREEQEAANAFFTVAKNNLYRVLPKF